MPKLVKTKRKINACTLFLAKRNFYPICSTDNISENSTFTEKAKQIKVQAKTKNVNELKEGWKDKALHDNCPIRAGDPDINSSLNHQWLASSGIKSEIESFIIAYQREIFKQTY